VTVEGNHMTQLYYTEHLLSIYIEAVNDARCCYNKQAQWLLIEDRDLSHRMKKCSVACKLKDANWITNLKHPAQLPDLNPIEGI
jgi:hypothetical protein